MRTYKDAKVMAKCLRDCLAARNVSLSHSECLEIVAQQFGFTQWNTLSAKLDVEAGRLIRPEDPSISLQPPIPTLRVASLEEAAPFYADFLGFQFDWGFTKGNMYAQISRLQITIHLNANSRLHGNAGMLIRMQGLDCLHRELSGKSGLFSPSEITFTPWDSRVFHVVDPFGNALQFWENNPPGVAKPIQRQSR
jgi:uncharacterized glyoxalase superfamily protein PhnB